MSAREAAEELKQIAETGSTIGMDCDKAMQASCYAVALCRKVADGELREAVYARWEEISAPGAQIKVYGCPHCHVAKSMTDDVPYCSNCGASMSEDEKGR